MNRRVFVSKATKAAAGLSTLIGGSIAAQQIKFGDCKKETTGANFVRAEDFPANKKAFLGDPKTHVWEVGDCRMYYGHIILRPDGTATFLANVKTEHTMRRDVWHVSIELRNSEGRTRQTIGTLNGPEMPEKVWMNWKADFNFTKEIFPEVTSATVVGCC